MTNWMSVIDQKKKIYIYDGKGSFVIEFNVLMV